MNAYANCCKFAVTIGAAGVFVFAAEAANIAWQGASNALWEDATSWVGGVVPGAGDTAVFDVGAGNVIEVDHHNTAALVMPDVQVLSGTVRILYTTYTKADGSTPSCEFSFRSGDNVFDIADGAVFELKSTMNTGKDVAVLKKVGLGEMRGIDYNKGGWGYNRSTFLKELHVVEGSLVFPGYSQRWDHAVVESGATLTFNSISSFQGFERIEAKSGATVNFNGGNNNTVFAGLTGEGRFVSTGHERGFTLWNGPYRFDGTFELKSNGDDLLLFKEGTYKATTDEEKHLVLGNANGFKDVYRLRQTIPLEFAEGISEFYLGKIVAVEGVPLRLQNTAGEPITVHCSFDESTPFLATGPGNICFNKATSVLGSQIQITGTMSADEGVSLTLGDGVSAENDFDPSTIAAIRDSGGDQFLYCKNVGDRTLDLPISFARFYAYGPGRLTLKDFPARNSLQIYGPTVLDNLFMTEKAAASPQINDGGALTVSGRVRVPQFTVKSGGKLTITGEGTLVHGDLSTEMLKYDTLHSRELPRGTFVGGEGGSEFEITDGASCMISDSNNNNYPSFSIKNGGSLILTRHGGWSMAASETRCEVYSDGGRILFNPALSPYNFQPMNSTYADRWTHKVGPGGSKIGYYGWASRQWYQGFTCTLNLKSATGVTDGRDGGLEIAIPGGVIVTAQQAPSGGVTLNDGYVKIDSDLNTATAGLPFGSGDFALANSRLVLSAADEEQTVNLGNGDGSKFRIAGGGVMDFAVMTATENSARARTQPVTVNLGPIERAAGGVLLMSDEKLQAFDGALNRVFVSGGVSSYADGMPRAPVFCTTGDNNISLMKYDSESGFVQLPDEAYTEGFGGGVDSVALAETSAKLKLTEDATVRAMRIRWNADGTATAVTINSGAMLTVGNGSDPAQVAISGNYNGRKLTAFGGEGTLNFGGSEGVFAIGPRSGYYGLNPYLTARIAGCNGVTYFAPLQISHKAGYIVSGDNTYTGGTRIQNCFVRAESDTAFGYGWVYAIGGYTSGATVELAGGVTMANDMTIGGPGICLDQAGKTQANRTAAGAIHFSGTNSRLTGGIVIQDRARITAYNNAAEVPGEVSGEIAGEISGGHLEIIDCANGPIAISGENTYSGGTELINAKVILRGEAPRLGTGEVNFDNAALQLENTGDLEVANRLTGAGDIIIAGEGAVRFTGDRRAFECGGTYLTRGRHRMATDGLIMPLLSTEELARNRPVLVLGNGATYTFEASDFAGDFEIVLEAGAKLVLNGTSEDSPVSFYRFTGNRDDVTGYFMEECPRAASMLIVK